MKKSIIPIGITLCVLLLAVSCGKRQNITVSEDRLLFDLSGGTRSFAIKADCDWTIETEAEATWITFSQLQGSKNATIDVTAERNTGTERSTRITIVSANGKTQKKIYIQQKSTVFSMFILGKIWFLRFYERWDLDYANQVIDDSYRSWTYYTDEQYENWFFYFADTIGYLIYRVNSDTTYYPYHYIYYPGKDSLYISFVTNSNTVEDYYARIYELTRDRFVFNNEYRHHQFEKLHTVNVSNDKGGALKINPKRVKAKPSGSLIPVE